MEGPPAKLLKRGGTETARQDGDGEKAQNRFPYNGKRFWGRAKHVSIEWKCVWGRGEEDAQGDESTKRRAERGGGRRVAGGGLRPA